MNLWNKKAKILWEKNQKTEAIQAVFGAINALTKKNKNIHVELFKQATFYLYFSNEYRGALSMVQRVLEITPNDLEALQNYIVCLNRVENFSEAIKTAGHYLSLDPDNTMIYDVLSVAHYKLGQYEKATEAGTTSLQLKHQEVFNNPRDKIIENVIIKASAQGAASYLKKHRKRTRHVISMSLFGDDIKYLYGAIRNLSLLDDIYTGWELWIYHDGSVPENFIALFKKMGAHLIIMPDNSRLRDKLTWRFHVANHPEVARFLVRDIDSVINVREREATDQWLSEDTLFHVMRDWWSHTELILAGMWGGVGGLLPEMQYSVEAYNVNALDNTHTDQHFLRQVIWQYVAKSITQHDRFFCLKADGLRCTNPWIENLATHDELGIDSHIKIGSCETATSIESQQAKIAPWLLLMESLEKSKKNQKNQKNQRSQLNTYSFHSRSE